MKKLTPKKKFLLFNAAIQAVFAVAFMCHRDPSIHWCAIAPIYACGTLLAIYSNDNEE